MAAAAQDALVAGLCTPVADVSALTGRERSLLAYADALTLTPWTITATYVTALREAGCDDLAIHDACAIVGYFAFVNRMADGLGVELEGESGSAGPRAAETPT